RAAQLEMRPSPPPGARLVRSLSLSQGEGRVRVIQWPPMLPIAPRVLHRLPDARRRGGAPVPYPPALRPPGLAGGHACGRAPGGPALANPLRAERIDDGAVLGEGHGDRRHVVALGNGVVHEAAREELPRLVVHKLLEEPGGEPLHGAALELALHDDRIDG